MRDGITPEEKLLRLIRGPRKNKARAVPDNEHSAETAAGSFFNGIIAPLASFRVDARVFVRWGYALSFVYLGATLAYPLFGLRDIKLPSTADQAELVPEPQNGVKPFDFYLESIGQKQVFGSSAGQFGASMPAAAAGLNVADEFNLVGIISGADPQAIIEEKKSNKTYYLSRGQLIGELRVDDIQEGKIVVDRRGQKFELYL